MSCGVLAVPYQADKAEASWRAAHDCVVARNSAHEPFRVVFNQQGTDSRAAQAYVAVDVAGAWTTYAYSYDGDPSGGGGENRPSTNRVTCAALVDHGMCTRFPVDEGPALFRSLCIECSGGTDLESCRTP